MPNYELAICEIVHPLLHGVDEMSIDEMSVDEMSIDEMSIDVNNHFLIYTTFKVNEFYNNSYKQEETRIQRHRQRENRLLRLSEKHPTLRRYNQHYIRLEIIQYIRVISTAGHGEYHVGILKTFWLRIVQRRWKKIFKARQELIRKRGSVIALQEKQRTGMWPKQLRLWPRFTLY
jgi:hypothetical protein